jgi:hypothetical protein
MTSNMATTTVPEDSEEEDEEEEEGRLSFGANKQTQTEVESKLRNLRLQEAEKAAAKKSHSEDLWNVMVSLSGGGKVVVPSPETSPDRQLLNAKYQIFLEQAETQRKYRDLVDKVEFNIAEGTKA